MLFRLAKSRFLLKGGTDFREAALLRREGDLYLELFGHHGEQQIECLIDLWRRDRVIDTLTVPAATDETLVLENREVL